MSLKDNFINYLRAYSNKDLIQISTMFSNDITLRDWKISVSGKRLHYLKPKKTLKQLTALKLIFYILTNLGMLLQVNLKLR
jgi:hypothetical protein